jgi:hypothetical protein
MMFSATHAVIPDKLRSSAAPESIVGRQRSTMDSGAPLRCGRNDGRW